MRLVLLPGLHGTDRLYPPFERALPDWIEPIALNYPLDGLSDYDEGLRFILDRLPPGPFALLGDSYSGPLALAVARALPERVIAVILCVSFVTNPMRPLLRWARLFAYTPFVSIAPRGPVTMMLINGRRPRAAYELVKREIDSVSPRVLAGRLRSAIDCDVRGDLAACAAPMLYLKARHDRIVSTRALRVIRAIRPSIESIELDGPHALLLMRPGDAAAAVAAFLARLR